ncbi:hypothetical protein OIU92_31500 [Escherichia coli]|nr:hypothetical protein [Escherichia coli]
MTGRIAELPAQGQHKRRMCGRGEGSAGDLGEESGCGPDTDSGHTGQDRVRG